jgi:hypothetical protein
MGWEFDWEDGELEKNMACHHAMMDFFAWEWDINGSEWDYVISWIYVCEIGSLRE